MYGRGRRWRRVLRSRAAVAIVVALVAVVAAVGYVVFFTGPTVVSGTVSIGTGAPMTLAPTFWAADVQGDPATPQILSFLEATPVRYVRGINLEGYDALTGLAYARGGGLVPWTTSVPDWKSFCESLSCHMIVTLPAEVNSTEIDIADVNYLEANYSFAPEYFALGNEPQGWANFNQPFSSTPVTNGTRLTPETAGLGGYVVNREAMALDTRFPGIRLIGIQSATCANDLFLSAFAVEDSASTEISSCHMYPGGNPGVSSESAFLSSSSVTRLASSLTATRAALAAACATCDQPLWVTEFNAAQGGADAPYMTGWPEVPFIAAQFVQLVEIGAPMFSFFEVACSGSPFDLLGPGCSYTPTARLYTDVFDAFRSAAMEPASFSGSLPGLYLLEGANASGHSLLVVNTNTHLTARITSLGAFPNATGYEAVAGQPGAGGFASTSFGPSAAPSSWSVPPLGVLLLNTNGG